MPTYWSGMPAHRPEPPEGYTYECANGHRRQFSSRPKGKRCCPKTGCGAVLGLVGR